MKRTVIPPLLPEELEPGLTVARALSLPHPFSLDPGLDPDLEAVVEQLCADPASVMNYRRTQLSHWQRRAEDLRASSIEAIFNIPDRALRDLYLNVLPERHDDHPVGTFVHFELWHEMASAIDASDTNYIFEFYNGLPVVGEILRSGVWRADPHPPSLSIEDLLSRA